MIGNDGSDSLNDIDRLIAVHDGLILITSGLMVRNGSRFPLFFHDLLKG